MRAGYIEAVGIANYYPNMPEPQIANDTDVKIQVKVCGICGSEIHALHGIHPFRIPPVLSGHEFSGVVVETGAAVRSCRVGDRVTAEPQYGCGKCQPCLEGKYNLCFNKRVLGMNGWSGSMGEYVVLPEKTVVKLADSVSYEEGALFEPVANGLYAVRRAGITNDSTIAVLGCGPIGLGDILCAKLYNPKMVIASDIADYNLSIAKQFGADYVVNSGKENLNEVVAELTNGNGVDMTILAFGNNEVFQQAAEITRRDGMIHQHAMVPDGLKFPYRIHQQHELGFKAYNMYRYEEFELLARFVDSGRISNLSRMITHRYPIEKYHEAMEMADKRLEPVIKVMLHFDTIHES